MIFRFDQIALNLSEKRLLSNDLLGVYLREANESAQMFDMLYHTNIHNLSELVDRAEVCFYQSIEKPVQLSVKMLVEHGIFDIDETVFLNNYVDTSVWNSVYDECVDAYLDIVASEEEKDAYRVARRQNRTRFQSYGGFGIGGAVKNAAKAGAMNMATGAAHMAFNGMAKLGSSIAATAKCASIFNDPNTFNRLITSVRITVENISRGYAKCIANHGDNSLLAGFPTDAEVKKANTIINNIYKVQAYSTQETELVQQVFELDPYNSQLYRYLLDQHRNAISEIRRMAKELHKTDTVNQYCDQLLRQAISEYDLTTEKNTQKSKAAYEALLYQLQMQDTPVFLRTLDEKLKWFDKQARTFEGVEYTTREEAAKANEEAQWIDNLLVNMKEQSLEELKANRDKITAKCTIQQVFEKRLRKLDKQIEKKDRQERTVDGMEHEDFESAAQAKKDAELIHAELANAKDLTLDELKQKRAKIARECTSELSSQYLTKLDVAIARKEQKKGKKIKKGYLDFRTPKPYKPHTVLKIAGIILCILFALNSCAEEDMNEVTPNTDDPLQLLKGTFYNLDDPSQQIQTNDLEVTIDTEGENLIITDIYIMYEREIRLDYHTPIEMTVDYNTYDNLGVQVVANGECWNDKNERFEIEFIMFLPNSDEYDITYHISVSDERTEQTYSQYVFTEAGLEKVYAEMNQAISDAEAQADEIRGKIADKWYMLNAYAPNIDVRFEVRKTDASFELIDFRIVTAEDEEILRFAGPYDLMEAEQIGDNNNGLTWHTSVQLSNNVQLSMSYDLEDPDTLDVNISTDATFSYQDQSYFLHNSLYCSREHTD